MQNTLNKAKGRFVTVSKGGEVYNGQIRGETPEYVRFWDRNTGRNLLRHKRGLSIRCGNEQIL